MPPEEIDLYIEKAANNAEIRVILLNHKKLLYSPEILEQIEAAAYIVGGCVCLVTG